MSAGEVTSSVETIEIEAERILGEARNRASEILRKANEEASRILSVELPLDKAKAECEQIINGAREEAGKKVEDAKRKAAELRATAKVSNNRGVEEIAKRIAGIITGAESR